MRGRHVLIEKPITNDLAQADELIQIAKQKNLALRVGHLERYNAGFRRVEQLAKNVRFIEVHRLGPFNPRINDCGVVLDLMIHDLDIVLSLVPSEVEAIHAAGRSVHSDEADVAHVQLTFESGCIATVTASRATEQKIRTLAITQPEAYIMLDYTDQDIQIHRRALAEYTLNHESIRYKQASFVEHLFVHKENPLKLEIQHLIRAAEAVHSGGAVDRLDEDDLRSLAVSLEVERMIREGRSAHRFPDSRPWKVR